VRWSEAFEVCWYKCGSLEGGKVGEAWLRLKTCANMPVAKRRVGTGLVAGVGLTLGGNPPAECTRGINADDGKRLAARQVDDGVLISGALKRASCGKKNIRRGTTTSRNRPGTLIPKKKIRNRKKHVRPGNSRPKRPKRELL